MSTLIKYDQARQALAACRNVDDIKDIRDKSEAMRLYAKQAQDTELEQWAAEIKFRAQRAIGELSAALEKQNGGFGIVPTGGKYKAEVLAEANISTSTANRYEKLASIPLADVEAFIAKHKEAGKPVSAKAVLATLVKPTPAPVVVSEPPAINEDAPDFSRLIPAEPEQADAYPDDDASVDVLDLLRAEESKVAALTVQVAALNERIALLGGTDQAARIQQLTIDVDSMHSLAVTRFNDLTEANNTIIKYKRLLDKMRKAAGVEKYGDILACITPIAKGA